MAGVPVKRDISSSIRTGRLYVSSGQCGEGRKHLFGQPNSIDVARRLANPPKPVHERSRYSKVLLDPCVPSRRGPVSVFVCSARKEVATPYHKLVGWMGVGRICPFVCVFQLDACAIDPHSPQKHTLVKYLLEELYQLETGFRDMLAPLRLDTAN